MSSSQPKRLLFITERYQPDLGGVARSAGRLASSLSNMGVKVDVLAWTKSLQPGQLETREETRELKLHRLGLFANWDLSLQHTFNVLEWLHSTSHYDAVWGHYVYPAGFAAVMFGATNGLPTTVSARGNDIDRLMFPPGDFARLLWTLERATVISAVSHDLAKKIKTLLGDNSDQIQLPNVTDVDAFHPLNADENQETRRQLSIDPTDTILGFSGELRHKKGLPFLLRSLRELNQVRPTVLLVIGGVRPKEQRELGTFTTEYPQLESKLVVTGHIDSTTEVNRYLSVCDVLLSPSLWDGVPNSILEAMACEKIVVASDAGGIPEIVKHGENGVLLPRAQLHRLSEAILEVLSLPDEQRTTISRNARRFCVNQVEGKEQDMALERILRSLATARKFESTKP